MFDTIHHIAIIGSDYEKSKHFYVDLLGFEIIRENYRKERDDYKIDLACGEQEIELFIIKDAPARVNYPEALGLRHLAFKVKSVDAVSYTHLDVYKRQLACKEVLHEPFAVINADDYYGKEAFVKLHDFLVGYTPEKANQFCMAGFILKNTLSENGAVTRGICETNEEGYLTAVHETSNIVKTPEGAAVDNDGQFTSINAESYASMNMWGLTPEFMQTLEDGFKEFFANMGDKDILKAEYLLPIYIDELCLLYTSCDHLW